MYVSSRHDDSAGQELHRALTERGAAVTFLQGDAGDTAWCESALATIRARHQRLDLLVLNACARPTPLRLGPQASARQAEYVRDNLRLVESPLAVFAELLNQSGGQIACISTSFVADPPAGFGHYVAVKNAAESLVRTVCRELPRTAALIARPPVLQTRWNDTPAGVPGSIPSHWAATHIIDALARESRPGEVTTLSEFPPIEDISRHAATTPPDFSIRLAASFTTDPLLPALRFWLKELELNAALEVAPYGQVLQSLLDPASPLNAKGRGFNVLLVRISDWLHEFSDEQVGDTPFVSAYLEHTAQDFVSAVRSHRAQASSETLLLLCPSESRQGSSLATLVRDTEARVIEAVGGISGLEVATAAQYHPHYGVREDDIHDPLRNEIGHIPFKDEYLFTLATIAVRHAHRRLAPVRKVVVVDCDNTLWRGVVGEVGADGVEFDEGHRALHRSLIRLAQNGVLVCLCSKNEESDVWRVFDTRDDLLLRREHVVAAMINWNPKSQNIRTLATRLNLGLDSFVFLDDNPVECAEVRSACPEVLTIEWPTQSDDASRLLEHMWEFDVREATREDERRTELYREEFKRQDLRAATLTFEDFINSLQLDGGHRTAERGRRQAGGAAHASHQPVQLHDHPARGSRRPGAGVRRAARHQDGAGARSLRRLRPGRPAHRGDRRGCLGPRHLPPELPRSRPGRRAPRHGDAWAGRRSRRGTRGPASARGHEAQHPCANVPAGDRSPGAAERRRPAAGVRDAGRDARRGRLHT